MKLKQTTLKGLFLFPALLLTLQMSAQSADPSKGYLSPDDVQKEIQTIARKHPRAVTLHHIARSPGGKEVTLLEITTGTGDLPALFTVANLEATTPLATEGALFLARMLLDSAQYTRNLKWFILPQPNPDGAGAFFDPVKWERSVNDFSVNDDVDDQTDEDGPEDLNRDGFITMMRVKDIEGRYVVSPRDPRLMVPADIRKGEKGIYKLYSEGIDNDNDGLFNEDGRGGINPGINFPHLFRMGVKSAGLWPGQSPEVYGIMEFIFSHPEIVMAFTLGSSDFCISPPPGGRRGGASMDNIRVPARFASRLGVDPEKSYSMNELVELFKTTMPAGGREITPDVVASMLQLGAVVNPLDEDLRFYNSLSAGYKEFLRQRGGSPDRMSAPPDKEGSFELWAYYHLGIPSFSMNLFTPPLPPAASDTGKEASQSREERIIPPTGATTPENRGDASSGREGAATSATERTGVPGSGATPLQAPRRPADPLERELQLLQWFDNNPAIKGFANWEPFQHPQLGEVEVGGFIPFAASTPPASMIDSLCNLQIPWLLQLTRQLPKLIISEEKITTLGENLFKLELFVENTGTLPWPVAMGARNRQPAPVILILEGEKFQVMEGVTRTPVPQLADNQLKKLSWMIRTEGKTSLKAYIDSPLADPKPRIITLGK